MSNNINLANFSEQQKVLALIVVGVLLLLYTLNIFNYSNVIVFLIGLGIVALGIIKAGYHKPLLKLIKRQ
jgi:hypothetical protein